MMTRLPFQTAFIVVLSLIFATVGRAQTTYEAENATLSGGASAGSSGGIGYAEYITTPGASAVTFSAVTVAEARTYAVDLRYAAARPSVASLSVYVNGADMTQVLFPSTGSWGSWATQTVFLNLQQGTNTIRLRYDADDSGWINLDYLQVKTTPVSAGFQPGAAATSGWFPPELSVDQFTGTAGVYVPLVTITATGVAVPLGLSYAAKGVQVDDRGGKVGVNWALSGEVSISRQVRGLPDDLDLYVAATRRHRYGWLMYPSGTPDAAISLVPGAPGAFAPASCAVNERTALYKLDAFGNLQDGVSGGADLYDSEPDVFTYALPGHTGRFVFDGFGKARTMPYDPITITRTMVPGKGITGFNIQTPDGISYSFDQTETISLTKHSLVSSISYFLRDFDQYQQTINSGIVNEFNVAWKASSMVTTAGDRITFTYQQDPPPTIITLDSRRLVRGNVSGVGAPEYQTESKTRRQWLKSVASTGAKISFELVPMHEAVFRISSATITYPADNTLIQRIDFDYYTPGPFSSSGRTWYDQKGGVITDDGTGKHWRLFLHGLSVFNGCTSRPLYTFTYDQTTAQAITLPPIGANDKDYWGFYNANGSSTLIPQLFLYPQLLSQPAVVPAAPYRLFEAPGYASGGAVLNGADRRPTPNFSTALAGTLTELVLPGGGKVSLEYEPHRFYDPVAQQAYAGGGTRIRAIRAQDPLTGVEVRREYGYLDNTGRASGVLLRAPRFAFALPLASSPPLSQWLNATVRSGDDLSDDPFENRAIGYLQVSEKQAGRGEIVTQYSAPGNADEGTAADGAPAGIPWTRPVMGVAREEYMDFRGRSFCPPVAPLQATSDLYPFAAATNYDFRRGLPLSVTSKAEPVGTNPAVVVRQETFAYKYTGLAPAGPPVVGLAYEQLLSGTRRAYAYAKYSVLTDFLYTLQQRTVTQYDGSAPNKPAVTWSSFNRQGWLCAQATSNSDGKYYITRYKYLPDYPIAGAVAADPRLHALQQRIVPTGEQISASLVETVSEIKNANGDVFFAGSTLNTFAEATATRPTRPFQVLRWQPAVPLPLATYDSTRVGTTAAGAPELHVNAGFQLVSTQLETTPFLAPLSTRTTAGRQLSAVHLGYTGTLPVLQIANALASEVLFSDFESTKDNAFTSAQRPSAAAARTGAAGLELTGGNSLSGPLTSATNAVYRLSFWARANAEATVKATATVAVSVGGGTGGYPPAAQSVNLNLTNGNAWRLYEVSVNLSGIPKAALPTYALTLQPTASSATVHLDDVLFLPVGAVAASTTYDLNKGKTSETDGRGRTVFYEYNVSGDLARVRDHNRAIVKELEHVVAGQGTATPATWFYSAGDAVDAHAQTFTAVSSLSGSCAVTGTEYSWDFGDGTLVTAFSSAASAATVQHTFNTAEQFQSFRVRLYARLPLQNTVQFEQILAITPAPYVVTTCTEGLVSVDDCGVDRPQTNSCTGGSAGSAQSTQFQVSLDRPGQYTYEWSYNGARVPSATSSSFSLPDPYYSCECKIRNRQGHLIGQTGTLSVNHYSSRGPGCIQPHN